MNWLQLFQSASTPSSPPLFKIHRPSSPIPKMTSLVNQASIPTLPLLYHTTTSFTPNTTPKYPPSSQINSKIGLIRTDITKLHLPNGAIVNAANPSLSAGGGACGAIHSAAGRDLAEECHSLRGCETGYAKMTRAYRLPCKKIIHTVGPVYWRASQTNEHSRLLGSCYTEVLKLCVKEGLTAVAFCAVSTGVYGYPPYEAAGTALEAVRRFMETEDGAKMELVVFCNFERKDEAAYQDLMSTYFPPVVEAAETAPTGTAPIGIPASKPAKVSKPTEVSRSTDTLDGATDTVTDTKPTKPEEASKTEEATETKEDTETEEPASYSQEPLTTAADKINLTDTTADADDFVLIDKEDVEQKVQK